VIGAIALRSVIRLAGAGALDTHWPGTAAGLAAQGVDHLGTVFRPGRGVLRSVS